MALPRTTSRLFSKAPTYTRPSQGTVNLSGFQGAPTAQGMGIAGMMPGFGGMASQGYMAALGKGYQAATANQSPIMSQALPGQGEDVRRLNAIADTPSPANSLRASAISQGNPMSQPIAAMSNGYYSPPSSVNQGRQYGLTLPMDLAGQQNRIANQNPMYAGMQSRFGAGSVIGQQADAIAAGQAASTGPNATMYEIPGSYGEMPTYNPLRPSPEVRFRSNLNGHQVSFNSNNDPVLTRQQAALRNYTPDAERGKNRKAAREATKARLADSRFKMQVSRGLNPNSAKAKAMFPDQVAKMNGSLSANNPMVPANPPGSIEAQMQGAGKVAEDLASNPHLIAIGASPESTLMDVNNGFAAHLASGGTFTDDSLKAFQQHAKAYDQTRTTDNNPFAFSQGFGKGTEGLEGNLWHELALLPDDPKARQDWLDRYRKRGDTVKNKSDQLNKDYPPVNPFPSMFKGGFSF